MRIGLGTGATALLAAALAWSPLQAQTDVRYLPDELLSAGTGLADDARHPTISDDGRIVIFEQGGELWWVERNPTPGPAQRLLPCDGGAPPDYCFDFPTDNRPRISGNGRYVLFDTFRPMAGLGIDTNFASDVYRLDRQTGTLLLVSMSSTGVQGDASSEMGDISRDGRYVTFHSRATNLVTGLTTATNRYRVYWKDLATGIVKLMPDRPGVGRDPQQLYPRISADGQRVMGSIFLFTTNQFAHVWEVQSDVLLSAGSNGYASLVGGLGVPDAFALSSDGRFSLDVQFGQDFVQTVRWTGFTVNSRSGYGLAGRVYSPAGPTSVSLGLDLSSGGGFAAHHSCYFSSLSGQFVSYAYAVSVNRAVEIYLGQGTLPQCEQGFDMTPNGRYLVMSTADLFPPAALVFETSASRNPFVGDTDGANDIILIENPLWNAPPTNVAQTAGVPAGSRNVQVSADGKKTVFESDIPASAFNGLYVDNNGTADVFEYDAESGEVSLLSSLDGVSALPGGGSKPSMSQDGRSVVFEAQDSGIAVPNLGSATPVSYGGGHKSVFLRNPLIGMRRVSAPSVGGAPDGSSMTPSISPNGRYVVFGSDASNVNPTPDTNGRRDVVGVDLETTGRFCVSQCPGLQSNGDSDQPSVSNGGDVAFASDATALQLKAGLSKGLSVRQILLRNQLTGRTRAVSQGNGNTPGTGPSERPQISGNGDTVVYESTAPNLPGAAADGRRHVFWFQASRNQTIRLSGRDGPGGKQQALNGDSGEPRVSADGRFIAFQSAASDLDPLDTNGVSDVFVYDTRRASLVRVADAFGGAEPNGASQTPHLNRNGTRLGFQSQASNFEEAGQGGAPLGFAAPLLHINPSGRDVVFADAFD